MKKLLILTLIAAFLALSVAVVFAQPQRMARAKRTFDRTQNRILIVLKANQEELGITDEQIIKIQDLTFSLREKSLKIRYENDLDRLKLQKLMQDRENLDYAQIESILAKTSTARNEMFIEGLKLREEVSNVLTPEQQEALKAMANTGVRNGEAHILGLLQQQQPPDIHVQDIIIKIFHVEHGLPIGIVLHVLHDITLIIKVVEPVDLLAIHNGHDIFIHAGAGDEIGHAKGDYYYNDKKPDDYIANDFHDRRF